MKRRSLTTTATALLLTLFMKPALAAEFLSCRSEGWVQLPVDGRPGDIGSYEETDVSTRFSISLTKGEMVVHDYFDEIDVHLPLKGNFTSAGNLVMHFSKEPSSESGPYVTTIVFSEATGVYTETMRYLSKSEVLTDPTLRDWVQSITADGEELADIDPIGAVHFGWGTCAFMS
jgi:hypothetical protein